MGVITRRGTSTDAPGRRRARTQAARRDVNLAAHQADHSKAPEPVVAGRDPVAAAPGDGRRMPARSGGGLRLWGVAVVAASSGTWTTPGAQAASPPLHPHLRAEPQQKRADPRVAGALPGQAQQHARATHEAQAAAASKVLQGAGAAGGACNRPASAAGAHAFRTGNVAPRAFTPSFSDWGLVFPGRTSSLSGAQPTLRERRAAPAVSSTAQGHAGEDAAPSAGRQSKSSRAAVESVTATQEAGAGANKEAPAAGAAQAAVRDGAALDGAAKNASTSPNNPVTTASSDARASVSGATAADPASSTPSGQQAVKTDLSGSQRSATCGSPERKAPVKKEKTPEQVEQRRAKRQAEKEARRAAKAELAASAAAEAEARAAAAERRDAHREALREESKPWDKKVVRPATPQAHAAAKPTLEAVTAEYVAACSVLGAGQGHRDPVSWKLAKRRSSLAGLVTSGSEDAGGPSARLATPDEEQLGGWPRALRSLIDRFQPRPCPWPSQRVMLHPARVSSAEVSAAPAAVLDDWARQSGNGSSGMGRGTWRAAATFHFCKF
ncbi:hypothetical protein WJX81_006012 [Elliptochloris bilobata]|uniref:Uncharacterized protein n=1 Tax=Elliptochloris bilobata TaxID=381761 RepID=A0AAW1R1N9_9CHLO